jgi:hypothetical protein
MRKHLAVFLLARLVIVDFHNQLTLSSISGMPSVNSDFLPGRPFSTARKEERKPL